MIFEVIYNRPKQLLSRHFSDLFLLCPSGEINSGTEEKHHITIISRLHLIYASVVFPHDARETLIHNPWVERGVGLGVKKRVGIDGWCCSNNIKNIYPASPTPSISDRGGKNNKVCVCLHLIATSAIERGKKKNHWRMNDVL